MRKFNPGTLQPDQEIKAQFVVRNHELNIALDVLRGNVDSSSCQHVLVVAPRGRGKTMLLTRVAAEIRTDEQLSRRLLPVQFMEESPEIFNLADFWLDALFHLSRESAMSNRQLARELRNTHDALTLGWQDESLEERARAAVLDAADRLDRKIVLMVENLQALSKNVDRDFGWKLRAVLQTEPQIILLASATSRFTGLDDAQQPFFELFRIVALEPLNTDQCRRLWRVASGEQASERNIRPLEILTGGSPRLLVVIAGFARHRSLRQLMEALVTLVDEHTEYFRSHLEALGKTERRVYVAVIDLWQLSKPGEIAARARMDIRTVSTMLGRLVKRGAVIVEGGGRKRSYRATERLFGIYYKLRRERNEAAIVENLIRFMAAFYGQEEQEEMFHRFNLEAMEFPAIREGLDRALPALQLQQGMASQEEQERLMQQIEVAFKEGTFEKAIEVADQFVSSYDAGSSRLPELALAWALHKKANACKKLENFEEEIAAYDEVIDRFGASEAPILRVWGIGALAKKGLVQIEIGRAKDALYTCEILEGTLGGLTGKDKITFAWRAKLVRTKALLIQQEYGQALDAFRSAYRFFDPETETMMADMLQTVPFLISGGASPREVADILASDAAKSALLMPLTVALRQLAGEDVRAPAEVLEVAADIRAEIQAQESD